MEERKNSLMFILTICAILLFAIIVARNTKVMKDDIKKIKKELIDNLVQ